MVTGGGSRALSAGRKDSEALREKLWLMFDMTQREQQSGEKWCAIQMMIAAAAHSCFLNGREKTWILGISLKWKRESNSGEKKVVFFSGERRLKLNDSIPRSADFSIKIDRETKCNSAVTFLSKAKSWFLFFLTPQSITAPPFHRSPVRTRQSLNKCSRSTAALQ